MTTQQPPIHPDPHGHIGAEVEVPHLEVDETVPPRPEEDIADAARAEDVDDTSDVPQGG
ncbi:hypothetical protein [Actinotalea sp.]|uniref:hypothetical protein n=1 Tax=Actinotalea sp. TaxID=1872145 RepID=UPI003564B343